MTTDPAAFFREMLGEWEKMANSLGGQMLKSDEFARTMHGANAASLNAQAQYRQMMERALAAANMPSRSELEDIAARIGRVEDALLRIETLLTKGAPPRPSTVPKPTRGRTPPAPV